MLLIVLKISYLPSCETISPPKIVGWEIPPSPLPALRFVLPLFHLISHRCAIIEVGREMQRFPCHIGATGVFSFYKYSVYIMSWDSSSKCFFPQIFFYIIHRLHRF